MSHWSHILSWLLVLALFLVFPGVGRATPVEIIGEARVSLMNSQNNFEEDVFETANLTIIVDGPLYRISCDSIQGKVEAKEEVGSDGIDTFMVNDSITPWNLNGKGVTGYAYVGRFPHDCNAVIQAVWLGYCARDFFSTAGNATGLPLTKITLSMSPPEDVTNIVTYFPGSTLPSSIVGWGGNRVYFTGIDKPYDLELYTNGYKAWEFSAGDVETNANGYFPRTVTLEGFLPWITEKTNVSGGDDVEPLRKVTFVAHSIRVLDGQFDPCPPVTVAQLSIIDTRFPISGKYIVVSHADPVNGWPVRSGTTPSAGYQLAEEQAERIARDNDLITLKTFKTVTWPKTGPRRTINKRSHVQRTIEFGVLAFLAIILFGFLLKRKLG